jgi:dUTP pyrophosphatase
LGVVTGFLNFTKSLVTSSAKIARTAFSSALSSLPSSPSGIRTSRPTDVDPLAGDWTSETDPEPDARAENGAWDPLAAAMSTPTDGDSDAWGLGDEAEAEAAPERERSVAATSAPLPSLDADMEELRFIRLSEAATLPTRAHEGDAGLDLYAAEGARIGPGQRVSVGTGLAVAIPAGLAGLVLPRSGLALKQGVTLVNSPGLIDTGYRGEVRILLLNTDSSSEAKIAKGDRIAQLLLVPIATANPLESDELDSTGRGAGGFGSTGA